MNRFLLLSGVMLLGAAAGLGQDFVTRGKAALSRRDTNAAALAFERALREHQAEGEANYYLGAIAFARRKFDDAVGYLEAATRTDDENVQAFALLARTYIAKGDTRAGLSVFSRAQKIAPTNAAVAADYGLALLAADSVDVAIIQLTRAKYLAPGNPAVLAGLGEAYLKQNVPPLAIMNYQRAISLAPRNFHYRYRLAEIYEMNRQYTEAVAQYDSVATLDPKNKDALLHLGEILVRATGSQKKLAIAPLRKFVASNPKSLEGRRLLVRALFLTGDFKEAASAARVAVREDPKDPDLWRQYAYSLVETRDFKTAVTAFDKLIGLKAYQPEDQTKHGLALAGVGRNQEAMQRLIAAVHRDTADCEAFFTLGSLYMRKRDYMNGAQMFEKKLICDPRSLSSYLNAAACYMQLRNWSRCRQLLDTALSMKPDWLPSRFMFAEYLAQVDSLARAKEQYERVLEQIGQDTRRYKRQASEAHAMIAAYYFSRKEFERCANEYARAFALGYDNSGSQLSWGQAILLTLEPNAPAAESIRKKKEAVGHFRKSIRLDSRNANAHLWLAQALVMSRIEGKDRQNKILRAEACREYKMTLRLQPGNQDARKGMERIGCR